jgi:hypothetical protein
MPTDNPHTLEMLHAQALHDTQVEALAKAALICERHRDAMNQTGRPKEANGAEVCRHGIQTVIEALENLHRLEG